MNGAGNSWADRVRGMHHAVESSVKSLLEVKESASESAEAAVSVHTDQQAVTAAAADKCQVSIGLCALVMSGFVCPSCVAAY